MSEINREHCPAEALRYERLVAGHLEPSYAELCLTTNFTFLTGASHPEEMVTRAAELGLAAIAITDRNSLAGGWSGPMRR